MGQDFQNWRIQNTILDSVMYEFAVTPAVTSIRRRGVEISDVVPDSLGAEMDLEAGDRIIRVNGRTVRDYLDFRFHTAGETELVLEVRKKNGDDGEKRLVGLNGKHGCAAG